MKAAKTVDQQSRAEQEAEAVKKKKPNLKDNEFNKYMPIILSCDILSCDLL
jgi:hypothetical protein